MDIIKRIKSLSLFTILAVLLSLLLNVAAAAQTNSSETVNAWVLTETVGYEYADKWTTADEHPSYKVSYSYGDGVYTAGTTYEGDNSDKKGTLGVKAVFTGVPDVIYPGQPVSLEFSFSTTENSVVGLSFSGNASADFDQWDLGPGSRTRDSVPFLNDAGKGSFSINSANEPFSHNETLSAQLGEGKEGSRIALRTKFSMGAPMGTNYIYEWRSASGSTSTSETATTTATTTAPEATTQIPQSTTAPATSAPSGNGNWWWQGDAEETEKPVIYDRDKAIVRFADMHGEVNVKGEGEDDDAWIFAGMNTPLRHGDMIKTLPNSGAVLSFSDGSTYFMKPDTVIILDIKNESQTKIGVLAGTIWGNLKKLVKDGSMEVELAQAVAGIKGTTFICESIEGISTLKVFEGKVAYTARADGKTIMVSDGQMIQADKNGLGELTDFDTEIELQSWDDGVQELTEKAIKANKNEFNLLTLILIIGLILLGGIAFVLIKKKRKKLK